MNAFKFVQGLGAIEVKNVQRDPILRWMVVVPLMAALGGRWLLPLVLDRAGAALGLQLGEYYSLIISFALVLLAPVMYGMVIGFLLLDQRDDRTLLALQVTPIPLSQYLLYKLILPLLLSLLLTPVALLVAGVVELPLPQLLLVALSSAPLAPLFALLLAAFAANKVQGLALMKAMSVFLIAPLVAQFVPATWRLAFGLLPTYWPTQLYAALHISAPYAWQYLLGAFVINGIYLLLLLQRFQRVVYR